MFRPPESRLPLFNFQRAVKSTPVGRALTKSENVCDSERKKLTFVIITLLEGTEFKLEANI